MIFLDYRACGPQGEPAVVHVDQANDYKITHRADSFEEFIRGLEHESRYDPDEDVEGLEAVSYTHLMKDLCQYGNRPEDEWEILPWIPDPRPPFKSG